MEIENEFLRKSKIYFRYEYHWCDGVNYKKPTALPAPQYITLLMDWVESQINNENLFPVKVGKSVLLVLFICTYGIQANGQTRIKCNSQCIYFILAGVPFPKNYLSSVKKILTRLHRVFVHVYIHHFDKLVGLGAVSKIVNVLLTF